MDHIAALRNWFAANSSGKMTPEIAKQDPQLLIRYILHWLIHFFALELKLKGTLTSARLGRW